jgi:hypothetical protein
MYIAYNLEGKDHKWGDNIEIDVEEIRCDVVDWS